ncbi:hypothetical protein G9A89_002248 [Geosiphon pyriformis]|nr:hypothetical protein G9A89_002248 [Geosiphon pyriformis]
MHNLYKDKPAFPVEWEYDAFGNMSTSLSQGIPSNFTPKVMFQYLVQNISDDMPPEYSPIFATSHDMFWQLQFGRIEPNSLAIYLSAVPNELETFDPSAWDQRKKYTAKLFLRNPITNKFIVKKDFGDLKLDASSTTWGLNMCEKSELRTKQVLVGVEFDKPMNDIMPLVTNVTKDSIPQDLHEAWIAHLDDPSHGDVQFSVQGKIIRASSKILSVRSEYFRKLFNGEDILGKAKTEKSDFISTLPETPGPSTLNTDQSTTPTKSWALESPIDVPDFLNSTFKEMLRFFYTNKVEFSKRGTTTPTSPLSMYEIAVHYQVEDLKRRAKLALFQRINIATAATYLFGPAAAYPELKEYLMGFVLKNFEKVRESENFKGIISNPAEHPVYVEIVTELFSHLSSPKW